MAIERIDGCIGCGSCVQACPTDVLRINEKTKKAEIKYPLECQVCYLCQQYCPVDAITVSADSSVPTMTAWG